MANAKLNVVSPQDVQYEVADEIIRLKALGNSLFALAKLANMKEAELDACQVEEIGRMVVELTCQIQDKLSEV